MVLEVPFLALAFMFSVLPVWQVMKCLRGKRYVIAGGCRLCGYNLTGNTSGVCPECGTAVAGKAGA